MKIYKTQSMDYSSRRQRGQGRRARSASDGRSDGGAGSSGGSSGAGSLQDIYDATTLGRSSSAESLDSPPLSPLSLKQQNLRRATSIQEAMLRATSACESRLSALPRMDPTGYRNKGLVFRDGRAYRTFEYQFASKKQKISLGRRQPVSIAVAVLQTRR